MLPAPRVPPAVALALVVAAAVPTAAALASTGIAAPDLVVFQIYSITFVSPDGNHVWNEVFAEVGNVGTLASPATTLGFRVRDTVGHATDGGTADLLYDRTTTLDVPALGAARAALLHVPSSAFTEGNPVPGGLGRYHVTATMDPADAIAESDESNNVGEADIMGGESPPT